MIALTETPVVKAERPARSVWHSIPLGTRIALVFWCGLVVLGGIAIGAYGLVMSLIG